MFANFLFESKIIKSKKNLEVFESLYPDINFIRVDSASTFFKTMWGRYLKSVNYQYSNDEVFKALVFAAIHRSAKFPLYFKASFYPFANINFDCVSYSKPFGPIILSANMCLPKEDNSLVLKSIILKQVHRRSKSFLITMDEREAAVVNKKIGVGLVLGLDKVIVASSPEFDLLVEDLKSYNLYQPEPVDVLTSTRFIHST